MLKQPPEKSSINTNKKPLATWDETEGCQMTSRAKPFLHGGDQAQTTPPSYSDAPHCAELIPKSCEGCRSSLTPTSTLFHRFFLPSSTCPRRGQGLDAGSPKSERSEAIPQQHLSHNNSSHHKIPSGELFPEAHPCKHGGSVGMNTGRTVIPAVIPAFAQTLSLSFQPAR